MGLFSKKQHAQVRQPHISDNNDAYIFRRSRTMTGSLSNTVRAVSEDRADLKSQRLKHHDLRRHRRRLLGWLMAVLAVSAALYGLITQYIPSVIVSVAPAVVQDRYAASIQDYLHSHPTERFFFSIDTSRLTLVLQAKYPEVKTVAVQPTSFLQAADAQVVVRQPIASWTVGSKKYYIDEHGVAFSQNYLKEPALTVTDNTGIDPSDAGAVASERMLRFIGRLVALVQQAGYTVEKVELPAQTSRQIALTLQGRGYPIRTNLDRDVASQAADVVAAVKYFDSKQITPGYVDVRVGSKAYYK